MTNATKVGQWNLARAATMRMALRANLAEDQANKKEAQLFRSLVIRAFNSRGATNGKPWKKLRPSTIKRKRSTKPLIDHGDLRNSISIVEKGNDIFVGVLSKTQRRGGGPLVNVAAVHEYGKIIVQKRGRSTVVIKIPERSFLRSTAKFHFKPDDVKKRFLARVAVGMGRGWKLQIPNAATLAKGGKEVAAQGRPRDPKGRFTKG